VVIARIFVAGCALLLAGFAEMHGAVVLDENFSYPDGALVTVAGAKWVTHSGIAGQVDVAAGKALLTQNETEDVNAALEGRPYATDSTTILYARFKVNFSALPPRNGGYFAHFKDTTTTGLRARVFALTNNAAPGTFRLGIANSASLPSAVFEADFNLNTEYTVLISYNVNAAGTALWVNPSAESDLSVSASDLATPLRISSFALRQSLSSGSGMGTLTVDDLVVATSFAEALSGEGTGVEPSIATDLFDTTVETGKPLNLSVAVSGTEPITYQWQHAGTNLPGATAAMYSIVNAESADAGEYQVFITNSFGSTNSRLATLTVTEKVAPIEATMGELHSKVDPNTFAPTNTTQFFIVEGIVTTYVNITSDANSHFYIQDDTGGIAVFVSGAATLRPNAGDRVRVTGPLGKFNGLLELNLLYSNPDHSVTSISSDNTLPAPKNLDFSLQYDPAAIEQIVGCRVIVRNVILDLTTPNFPGSSGGNVVMTDVNGETFILRVDGRVADIIDQPKPTTSVDIIGVLGQFDSSSPFDSGFQLIPTRFADIFVTSGPEIAATLEGDSIRLSWNGQTGLTYSIWSAPDVDGPYLLVASNILPDSGVAQFIETISENAGAKFYRISVP
jgi:hypothetical protein